MYAHQFGFRKNHSTRHAIITLVERVSNALNTAKYAVGVFLDLKKAYDTVDHNILLEKWNQREYLDGLGDLTERSQYVEYNNCKSDENNITHGVPDGSILGPLLYI